MKAVGQSREVAERTVRTASKVRTVRVRHERGVDVWRREALHRARRASLAPRSAAQGMKGECGREKREGSDNASLAS